MSTAAQLALPLREKQVAPISFRVEIEPRSLQKGARQGIRKTADGRVFIQRYTDRATENYRASVTALCAPHRPAAPLEGPVWLSALYVVPRPGRLQRKSDPAGRIWCDQKPDVDNLTKGFKDILTKARFWVDDKQVAFAVLGKFYARKDEAPCIEVLIRQTPPNIKEVFDRLFA